MPRFSLNTESVVSLGALVVGAVMGLGSHLVFQYRLDEIQRDTKTLLNWKELHESEHAKWGVEHDELKALKPCMERVCQRK